MDVFGYIDFAEVQAMSLNPVYTGNQVEHWERGFSTSGGGKRDSHSQKIDEVNRECRRFSEPNGFLSGSLLRKMIFLMTAELYMTWNFSCGRDTYTGCISATREVPFLFEIQRII